MKQTYVPPSFDSKKFHCPICGVYAHQVWGDLSIHIHPSRFDTPLRAARCGYCNQWSYWYDGKMIVPAEAPVEPRHPDLPEQCITEYDEAREVFAKSPRASAALLRLCIQKLMPVLGQGGKNINADIAALVKDGLPAKVQQALDFCRVVGNNAVHPGTIDLNDTPDIAQNLFRMINFIVEDRITRPNEIEELYNKLPESQLKAVKDRDGDNSSA